MIKRNFSDLLEDSRFAYCRDKPVIKFKAETPDE